MNKVVVEQLILSIFNGTSNENIARNSRILDKFVEQQEAWSITVELVKSDHDGIRYFASNMLYTKVRKHWDQLGGAQRQDLYDMVGQLLSDSDRAMTNMTKIFLNRLVLTYFSICCHIPGGLSHYLNIAASVITSHVTDTCVVNVNKVLLGCSMLSIVPHEIEVIDIPCDYRSELTSCCMALEEALLNSVALPLAALLTTLLSSQAEFADAALIGDLLSCYLQVLNILRSWCPLLGLSLTKLYKSYQPFYSVLLHSVQIAKAVLRSNACKYDCGSRSLLVQKVGLLIGEALLLVKEVVGVSEYPPDEAVRQLVLDQAILKALFIDHWDILSCLLHIEATSEAYLYQMTACFTSLSCIVSDPLFNRPQPKEHDMFKLLYTEDLAFALTECVSSVLSSEMYYLSTKTIGVNCYTSSVDTAVVLRDHMRVFFMAVLCTLQRPRKLVIGVFEVWATLQDMPMVHRQSSLCADIYGLVVLLLIEQLTFQPSLGGDGDIVDDSSEDITELRDWDNGIQDTMILSYYALGNTAFFSLLFQRLHIQSTSPTGTEGWYTLEAVLCVVSMISGTATGNDGEDFFTASQLEAVPYFIQLSRGVLECLQHCCNVEYQVLIKAICKFINGISTFIFNFETPNDLDSNVKFSIGELRFLISDSLVCGLLHLLEVAAVTDVRPQLVTTIAFVVTRGGRFYSEGSLQSVAQTVFRICSDFVTTIPTSFKSGMQCGPASLFVPARLVGVLAAFCHSLNSYVLLDALLTSCVEMAICATTSVDISVPSADLHVRLYCFHCASVCISQAFLTMPPNALKDTTGLDPRAASYLSYLFQSSAIVRYLSLSEELCLKFLQSFTCADSLSKLYTSGICNSLAEIQGVDAILRLDQMRSQSSVEVDNIIDRLLYIADIVVAFCASDLNIPCALSSLQEIIKVLAFCFRLNVGEKKRIVIASCLISKIGVGVIGKMTVRNSSTAAVLVDVIACCKVVSVFLIECSEVLWLVRCDAVQGSSLSQDSSVCVTCLPHVVLSMLTEQWTANGDNIYAVCKTMFETLTLFFYPSTPPSILLHSFWLHNMLILPVQLDPQVLDGTCCGFYVFQVLIKLLCGTLSVGSSESLSLMLPSVCWPLLSEALYWIIKGCATDFHDDILESSGTMSVRPDLMPKSWYIDLSSKSRHLLSVIFSRESDKSGDKVGVNLIPGELRAILLGNMFELCLVQDNRRKFKMIVLDILKVCYGESSVDCLQSHVG